jgi:hypothetical protein
MLQSIVHKRHGGVEHGRGNLMSPSGFFVDETAFSEPFRFTSSFNGLDKGAVHRFRGPFIQRAPPQEYLPWRDQ